MNESDRGSIAEYVITSLALGFVLEALTPHKVSTVSYVKPIKNLNIYKFLVSTFVLYDVFKSVLHDSFPGLRFGYWVREGVKALIDHPAVGTNTSLGYLMLSIPIVYALKDYDELQGINPYNLAVRASTLLISKASDEDASDFYEALQLVNPSYANSYTGKVPDIRGVISRGRYRLSEILIESSYWDLIAYDITHNYVLTLDAHYFMLRKLTEDFDLFKAVNLTQLFILSRLIDSEVFKSGSTSSALGIKAYCGIIIKLINNYHYVEDYKLLTSKLDAELRSKHLNTGTVADILALATSFTLISLPGFNI